MFAEAEKQNEEVSERTSEAWAWKWLKQEMAQTGLFEKVRKTYLKKTLIEV